MILNERQYRITRAAADKFRASLAAAESGPPPPKVAPALHRLTIAGLRSQLETLEAELRAYEGIQSAKGKKKLDGRLEDLGLLLIQARIARGWSQRELGEHLGVKMQQIQRYEATGYASASLARLLDVATALGVTGRCLFRLVGRQRVV